MVDRNSISTLAFALLGLIGDGARSGYDLRKFFSSSPMTSFSDSPGAIYPALRRLEQQGLVRGETATQGSRERTLFRVTARGRAEFRRWQMRPISREEVIRHVDTLMLRFAFMDQFAGKPVAMRFLKDFQKELAAYIPGLRVYLKSNREQMPLSGQLALESGIQEYETLYRWTKTAIAAYQNKGEGR
jgi:DNA-binding PadR family transcriptional regulator